MDVKSQGRNNSFEDAVLANEVLVHYAIILDDSSSMDDNHRNQLKPATDEFLTALTNSKEANSSIVSCFIYNISQIMKIKS